MNGDHEVSNEYLIIEYAPSNLDNNEFRPVRMDGHYLSREDAKRIAEGWAAETTNKQTRIVVVEVVEEVKQPDYRKEYKSNT